MEKHKVPCRNCGSMRTYKRGFARGRQRWKCHDCGFCGTENPDPKNGGGRRPKIYKDVNERARAYRARLKAKKAAAIKALREIESAGGGA